ncbi:GtrA family protein [Microbacterium sp. NPDC057944]|uniref:GtrA family protein n=1 Tax=Microbacterium sp. NPDC057944 TaxID=3346286 RepID=UPI0036D88D33
MSEVRRPRLGGLAVQIVKFAAVGGVGLIVDVAVFNLLLLHPMPVAAWPMVAKVVSTALAIVVNWVGNRLWTFRDRRRADAAREAVEFLIASLIGSGVSLLCLGVSHYLLNLTTTVDDNVSANVIGLLAGSAVRFAAYRWWVFAERGIQTREAVKVTTTVAPTP